MAARTNVVTVVAKLLGGRQMERELTGVGNSIKKTADETKKADDKVGGGKGWELFTKKSREARKETEKHSHLLKGLGAKVAGYGVGVVGAYGAFDIAKNSISTFKSSVEEVRRAEALGLSGKGSETFNLLAVYKARGIGYQELAMGAKALAKAQFLAGMQEEKYATAQKRFSAEQRRAAESGRTSTAVFGTQLGVRAKAFKELHINLDSFRKLDAAEQFRVLGKALAAMPAGTEKTRLATELLGKSATRLLPAFVNGKLGVTSLEKAAKELIPNLGKGTKGFEEMETQQAYLSLATQGLQLRIGMALTPILVKLMKTFTKLYVSISHGRGVWKTVGDVISKVASTLKETAKWILNNETASYALAAVLGTLAVLWSASKIWEFLRAIKAVWLVTKLWTATQWLFTDALIGTRLGLAALWIEENLVTLGVAALVAGLIYAIIHWKQTKAVLMSIVHWIVQHKDLLALVPVVGPMIWVTVQIVKHWSGIVSFVKSLPHKLAQAGVGIWDFLKHEFKSALNWVLKAWNGIHIKLPEVLGVGGGTISMPHIPLLAKGGTVRTGGSAIVGERGPEWLNLPSGAVVQPLQRAGGYTAEPGTYRGGPGGDLTVSVQLDRKEIGRAVIKQINMEQARMA